MLELSASTLKPICGIYEIENTVTGRCYIGQSIQIQSRWTTHFNDLANNRHSIILMQRDWEEYGPESFKARIVRIVNNADDLLSVEEEVARGRLKAGKKLYNKVIAGWYNEDEHAARLARKRDKERKKRDILQRKRERLDETRNQRGSDKGDDGFVYPKRNIQGGRRISRNRARASVEGHKRKIREQEAGIQSGEQRVDRQAGAKGSTQQGLDENRQRGEGNRNADKPLPVFDSYTAETFTQGLTPEEADLFLKQMRKDLLENFDDAMGLANAIRAVCTRDELRTISEVCDPLSLVIHFHDEADFNRARAAVGKERTKWLMEQIDGQ